MAPKPRTAPSHPSVCAAAQPAPLKGSLLLRCRGAQCAPVRSYTSAKRPGRIWNPPLRCQRTNLARFSFCIRRGALGGQNDARQPAKLARSCGSMPRRGIDRCTTPQFHMLPCNFPTAQGPAGEHCSPLHLPCAFPLSRKPSSFQRKFTSVFVTSPVAIWRCTTYNKGITARALRMCFRSVLFL